MKLHNSFGMNPRTVRMFLLEKQVDLDTIEVDLLGAENRQPAYLAKNPSGQLPLLELDDGTCIAESAAICEYLEAAFPDAPPLIGDNAKDQAITRMWWRRVELEIARPMVHAFYYAEGYDIFKTRVHCIPEAADSLKQKARNNIAWLEDLLEEGGWIAGDRFTVADICLYCYVDQLRTAGQPLDPSLPKVNDWFQRVAARPSAEASLFPVQPMGMRG